MTPPTYVPLTDHQAPKSASFRKLNKYLDKPQSMVMKRPASAPATANYTTDRFAQETASRAYFALPKDWAHASERERNRFKERDENKLMRHDLLQHAGSAGWSHNYFHPPLYGAGKQPMFQTLSKPQLRPGSAMNTRMKNTHGRLFEAQDKPRRYVKNANLSTLMC
jgi:hypothetical protein